MSDLDAIVAKLLQRASEACYWKEEAENNAVKAETYEQRKRYFTDADRFGSYESIWNEAAAIVRGERP